MQKTPQIESWEDRSGGDGKHAHAFGYVYFDDGSRVGFSVGTKDTPPVWQPRTNGGGERRTVSARQLADAYQFLKEQGVPVDG